MGAGQRKYLSAARLKPSAKIDHAYNQKLNEFEIKR